MKTLNALKAIALVMIMSLAATTVHAQKNTLMQKENVVGLGIGFGGNLYSGSGYTSRIPAISLYYERGVVDHLWDDKSSIGVGGLLGYTSAKWKTSAYGADYGWKYSSYIIGARGALHYTFVDKLDTYTGLMLGYNIVSTKEIGNHSGLNLGATGSEFTWSWFVGARYYFTDSFAAFAELGYGIAVFNIGVSLKF